MFSQKFIWQGIVACKDIQSAKRKKATVQDILSYIEINHGVRLQKSDIKKEKLNIERRHETFYNKMRTFAEIINDASDEKKFEGLFINPGKRLSEEQDKVYQIATDAAGTDAQYVENTDNDDGATPAKQAKRSGPGSGAKRSAFKKLGDKQQQNRSDDILDDINAFVMDDNNECDGNLTLTNFWGRTRMTEMSLEQPF